MRVCVMTPSQSLILIIDNIIFNEERTAADLILNKVLIGRLDLTNCKLKKLNRNDNDMEYFEVVEKNDQ